MFKYYTYDKVNTEDTVLEFRGGDENAQATIFTGIDVNVVSIAGDEADIDALAQKQDVAINLLEIDALSFSTYVKDSDQIASINRQVKSEISKHYDIADEIAMMKRSVDDSKRIEYETYVDECKAKGDALKSEIGY